MATIDVLDATSNVVALEKPLTPGRSCRRYLAAGGALDRGSRALSLSSLAQIDERIRDRRG
jgi:hypothetical protein